MTLPSKPGGAAKRPYEKPTFRKVPLRPEEAVLGACKNGSTSGPVGVTCSVPLACSSPGS